MSQEKKFPSIYDLEAVGNPKLEGKIRLKRTAARQKDAKARQIGRRQDQTEIQRRRDEIFYAFVERFLKNLDWYTAKYVGNASKYGRLCVRNGLATPIRRREAMIGGKAPAYALTHVINFHVLTGVPVGTALTADLEYLTGKGIIRFVRGRCQLHPEYFTDGFYFFHRNGQGFDPLGDPERDNSPQRELARTTFVDL